MSLEGTPVSADHARVRGQHCLEYSGSTRQLEESLTKALKTFGRRAVISNDHPYRHSPNDSLSLRLATKAELHIHTAESELASQLLERHAVRCGFGKF